MTQKSQKTITIILVTIAVMGGFEALIYIVNLNQIREFLWTALAIWLYLWLKVSLIYDLHFKKSGSLGRAKSKHESTSHWLKRFFKIFFSAIWDRIEHFRKWNLFFSWANYLLLPGLIFWSTVALFFLNLGRINIQQIFAALSAFALIITFWNIKEIYTRKEEKVALSIFAALSAVKIYTALLIFGALMSLTHYYCLEPKFLFFAIFACTFLLIYQALFQHKFNSLRNLFWTIIISLALGFLAFFVYLFWGYNSITAAVFLTAFYNLFWGVFHHTLEKNLIPRVFWELIIVSVFIALMAISVTNFKAQIFPGCF